MKLEKTIDFLNYLLEPLDLLAFKTSNSLIAIKHINSRNSIAVALGNGLRLRNFQCIYYNIDHVFDDLFNYAIKILYVDKSRNYEQVKVQNPYFKCQNLEEALIRRDLMSYEA